MPFANILKRREYHRNYYRSHSRKISKRTRELRGLNNVRINKRQRDYWKKNRSRILAWRAEYREKNKEKIRQYHEKYRALHRDRVRLAASNFKKKHQDRVKFNHQVQKAKRKKAGIISVKDIQRVYENNIKTYETLTCCLCLKPIFFGDDSLEHLIPLSRGGTNAFENLAISHLICNQKKGSLTAKEYVNRAISNAEGLGVRHNSYELSRAILQGKVAQTAVNQ